jgi:ABC-type lipoprotein release transport system permease subunit
LAGVLRDGALMGLAGIVAGAVCGFALVRLATSYFPDIRTPGLLPLAGSAIILLGASVVASMLPAMRAAHVDVIQALRTE